MRADGKGVIPIQGANEGVMRLIWQAGEPAIFSEMEKKTVYERIGEFWMDSRKGWQINDYITE